ncbi:MAG: hypothetical protein A2X36_06390 [Elusimicrobia bacterium GWA2_69_24]|nr:MAG: hypothetical protein A2X36_06390 [Elusimicrobia bacterium GWA2_69_24]HBL17076.1 methyltransferase [Elusimicrobiota bacterium]
MLPDPGSFRDPGNRVFYDGERVCRGLDSRSAADWRAVSSRGFFTRRMAQGSIVRTTALPADDPALQGWEAALVHERIPFLSYPFEWSCGMLQDAALLQLDLLLEALAEDVSLKDATPYNIQWNGPAPVFIDIPSFEPLRPGSVWTGYRQFCELFLYPLMLQAYKGIPFRPWLRGAIDGIRAADCARVFTWADLLRPGVLKHVWLQSRLQAGLADSQADLGGEIRDAGFHKGLIEANLRGLRGLVAGLSWSPAEAGWAAYGGGTHYSAEDREKKTAFIRKALGSRAWPLAWDLGCNTGEFSRLAAADCRCVVAMDSDASVIETLYRSLKAGPRLPILPLQVDFADPSPGLGWRGRERRALSERGRPDLTLALALIHHLCLGSNVPLAEVLDWLAGLGGSLIVEFVDKSDPMARRLMRNKGDIFPGYSREAFERGLETRFTVLDRLALVSVDRVLYFARPRAG